MIVDNHPDQRILVLGSESAFSGVVLRCLLRAGTEVCGFIIHQTPPASRAFERLGHEMPVVVTGTGPAIASENDVPVFRLRSMQDEDVLDQVSALAPDFVLVACFPMILDGAWLTLARHMCLNVHPSVLPAYRGPAPLFWQFREGEHETGVTLHLIEEDIDAGDIVAQSVMPLPAGAHFSEVNATLAEMGAALAVELLQRLHVGMTVPGTTQDKALASYQPFPKEKDFRFDTHFTAERAFRFIRGTREWGVPFEVDAGDAVLVLEDALDYYDDARMAVPFEVDGDKLRIRFSEGVLEALGRRVSGS